MPFDEAVLSRWTTATEEKESVVSTLLKNWGFKLVNKRGSHVTYEHESLKQCAARFPNYIQDAVLRSGRLVVISTGGQKVKGYILRRIVEACGYIKEYEAFLEKKGGSL